MSTSYYALRAPVAAVRPWPIIVTMYDIYADHARDRLGSLDHRALHLVADRDVKVAHRDNAGAIVVTHPGPDDMQAISERGELVTLGQLRRGEAP